MELRHLKYFCAVAEHRSFTLAARQLNVSQSGVSGQIQDLEKEIRAPLFRRNRREVMLTPEGHIFFDEAKEILARAELAVERVLRVSRGQTGRITIGLCGPVTAPFLPKLIRAFRSQYPGVVVGIREWTPAEQVGALLDGKIDIGFTRNVPADAKHLVSSDLVLRETVVVALPKDHALAKEKLVTLGKLAGEDFILYCRDGAPPVFDSIVAMCRRAKFSPKIAATSRSWQSVLTMVESGEGAALVPECIQHLRANDIVFRPLADARCRLDAFVIWRRSESNILIERFLALLWNRPTHARAKSLGEAANKRRTSELPSAKAEAT